jgi:hypothetical protein
VQAPRPDGEVSGHRTRTNRWPEPTGYDGQGAPLYPWQQAVPATLAAAVEAVYDALEDRD